MTYLTIIYLTGERTIGIYLENPFQLRITSSSFCVVEVQESHPLCISCTIQQLPLAIPLTKILV